MFIKHDITRNAENAISAKFDRIRQMQFAIMILIVNIGL